MDGADVRKLLPRREIFEVDGVAIGIFHGEGPSEGILDAVRNAFKDKKLDVVVFGHSHQPFNKMIGDTLYFNPGSPNDMVRAPYCSYGILEINFGKVTGKIIKLKG
jgi:putative phosphoesterase